MLSRITQAPAAIPCGRGPACADQARYAAAIGAAADLVYRSSLPEAQKWLQEKSIVLQGPGFDPMLPKLLAFHFAGWKRRQAALFASLPRGVYPEDVPGLEHHFQIEAQSLQVCINAAVAREAV